MELNFPYSMIFSGREWYQRFYAPADADAKKRMWRSFKLLYTKFVELGLANGHTVDYLMPRDTAIFEDPDAETCSNARFDGRSQFYFAVYTSDHVMPLSSYYGKSAADRKDPIPQQTYRRGMLLAFALVYTFKPKPQYRQQYPSFVYLAHVTGWTRGFGGYMIQFVRSKYAQSYVLLEVDPPHHNLFNVYKRHHFDFASRLSHDCPLRRLLADNSRDASITAVSFNDGDSKHIIGADPLREPEDVMSPVWIDSVWMFSSPVVASPQQYVGLFSSSLMSMIMTGVKRRSEAFYGASKSKRLALS